MTRSIQCPDCGYWHPQGDHEPRECIDNLRDECRSRDERLIEAEARAKIAEEDLNAIRAILAQ